MSWIRKSSSSAETAINQFSRVVNIIGIVFLVAIALLTVADVLLRLIINRPILGSTEVTEYMMVGLVFGMGLCALRGRQIKMDMVMERFPKRVQAIVDCITYLVAFGAYVIIAWQNILEAFKLQKMNLISGILKIPTYPFYLVLAFGCILLSLAIVVLFIKSASRAVKNES